VINLNRFILELGLIFALLKIKVVYELEIEKKSTRAFLFTLLGASSIKKTLFCPHLSNQSIILIESCFWVSILKIKGFIEDDYTNKICRRNTNIWTEL